MPFEFNGARRHRIPKAEYRLGNLADYDRGLVQRGDIRLVHAVPDTSSSMTVG